MRRVLCCGYGHPWRHRLVCLADNLSHAVRIHWEWLCDYHDALITKPMDQGR